MANNYFGFTPGGTIGGSSAAGYNSYAAYGSFTSSGSNSNIAAKTPSNTAYAGYGTAAPTPARGYYAAPVKTGTTAAVGSAPNKAPTSKDYTGYDAAVYAAATSYLHSKATGASNQWFGMKRGASATAGGGGGVVTGGRGTFSRKGQRPYVPPSQMFFCETCKISCAGNQAYEAHLAGQKHKKRQAQVDMGKSAAPAPNRSSAPCFRCELCQVACTGKDTYNAHIRGKAHQKTAKLYQSLGKPVPDPAQPTQIGGKKQQIQIVAVPKVNFVGGRTLQTTGGGAVEIDNLSTGILEADDTDAKPVGEDYVESRHSEQLNRIVYWCKLCSCEFNDTVARAMHLKGRRHRMEFKKKVDPSLQVDLGGRGGRGGRGGFGGGGGGKGNQVEKVRRDLIRMQQQDMAVMRNRYEQEMAFLMQSRSVTKTALFPSASNMAQKLNEFDDKHVMAKHAEIYPTEQELTAVQRVVTNTERSLKGVSDMIADDFAPKEEPIIEGQESKPISLAKASSADDRTLKGVMRVGALAKGLLLRSRLNVQLVCLCSEKPTRTLLAKVAELLIKQFKDNLTDDQYEVRQSPENACIFVSTTKDAEAKVQLTISLTSPLVRGEGVMTGIEQNSTPDPVDLLDKQKCLEALAALRHAKWFQARCSSLPSCLVLLRVMRDLCHRVPTWTPLTNWALELLVEKVLSSTGAPLRVGEGFRRVFETVSSGIMLNSGPGLLDPCEKVTTDALTNMSPQQREDITASAQHALRLVAFEQIHKVLGIEKIVFGKQNNRKRPAADPVPMETNESW